MYSTFVACMGMRNRTSMRSIIAIPLEDLPDGIALWIGSILENHTFTLGLKGLRNAKLKIYLWVTQVQLLTESKGNARKVPEKNETVEELKWKYRFSSFEEFERKILEGEIGPSCPGDLSVEDAWLLWSEIEYKQKRLVTIKPQTQISV